MPYRVYLSLGSNLGDRTCYLAEAVARLGALPGTRMLATSSALETAPWGVTDQPAFLNMAAILETTLTPEQLLEAAHAIEAALGRQRTERWGPRTIDIDLLYVEGETRDTPALHLPHPQLTTRRFVLAPLAQIAPTLRVQGKTVQQWLEELPADAR